MHIDRAIICSDSVIYDLKLEAAGLFPTFWFRDQNFYDQSIFQIFEDMF